MIFFKKVINITVISFSITKASRMFIQTYLKVPKSFSQVELKTIVTGQLINIQFRNCMSCGNIFLNIYSQIIVALQRPSVTN